MKLSRLLPICGIAAIFLAAMPACNKGPEKIKIAIVTNNSEEFWTFAEAGARKAAKDFDVEVIFRKPEKGEVSVQMDIVNALVKQGIKGIAVSVIDPENQVSELKQIASKVKLIAMDNDAPGSNRVCYVGTDNYEAGRALGKLVQQVMPDGGTIAVFVGQITPINAQERFQGVIDVLAGEKGAKGPKLGKYTLWKNAPITDNANRETAQNNASRELGDLGDRPDVCMVGLWAYNPPTILKAAKGRTFKNIKIVGFDEDWDTLAGIERGEIYATVVQDPFNFAYKSVEILASQARDPSKKINSDKEIIPYRIVTKDGINPETGKKDWLIATEFRDELKKLLDSVK